MHLAGLTRKPKKFSEHPIYIPRFKPRTSHRRSRRVNTKTTTMAVPAHFVSSSKSTSFPFALIFVFGNHFNKRNYESWPYKIVPYDCHLQFHSSPFFCGSESVTRVASPAVLDRWCEANRGDNEHVNDVLDNAPASACLPSSR